MDWKLFGYCENCKKRKLVVKKRTVRLPIGLTAKSQKLICKPCAHEAQQAVDIGIKKDHGENN